jgi:hypothetical protein
LSTKATNDLAKIPAPRRKPAQERLDKAGVDEICSLIANGVTYRDICERYDIGMNALITWMDADTERSHACARARELAAQSYEERAEELIDGADDAFALSKAKELAIHLRWRAAKANPRRYGEKVTTEVTGSIEVRFKPAVEAAKLLSGGAR